MEIMVAWYPTLKLVSVLLVLGTATMLSKHKWHKTSGSILLLGAYVLWMIPVHIDGTESSASHKSETQYQNDKYNYQSEKLEKVQSKTLTFDEQMKIIDEKNKVKNAKIEETLQ